jgi:hypothetical protein
MSGDGRPVRPGIVEAQGEQALTKRVDVIRETIRGLHQGRQPCGAAPTGQTDSCTRPVLINAQKPPAPRGPFSNCAALVKPASLSLSGSWFSPQSARAAATSGPVGNARVLQGPQRADITRHAHRP